MFVKFKKYLLNSFEKGTVINSYNLKALVLVGTFSHPLFALIHVHVFKMPWDSMGFKLAAGLICFLLIFTILQELLQQNITNVYNSYYKSKTKIKTTYSALLDK